MDTYHHIKKVLDELSVDDAGSFSLDTRLKLKPIIEDNIVVFG